MEPPPGGRRFHASVNAHTHIYAGLAPLGMPRPARQPRSLIEILESTWWRLDRALDERSLRAAARLYVAEARSLGTRVVIDHHESPSFIEGSLDVIADACEEFGMYALLCYGATERNGGRAEARRGLAECRRFILSNRRKFVRGAVGLHATFTVSDDTIRDAARLCRDLGAVLHLHVAEDRIDAEALSRLFRLEAVGHGTILAHGVHLNDVQVRKASDLGAWFVQNPRSNLANRVGYPAALPAARRVALGTDGFPSDLSAEAEVLRRYETDETVEARLRGSDLLGRELFGAAPDRDCGEETPAALTSIREEAAREAVRLWERMRAIDESPFAGNDHR